MEEILKKERDLRLRRLEQAIKKIKDENGFIRTDSLETALKEEFGTTMGGEYFMDRRRISGIVGIPVLQKDSEYLTTAQAAIYATRKGKNELLAAAKRYAEETGINTAIAVGGKVEAKIPLQKMYLEIASEVHNRLLERFGDRVLITAVVGGTGTRNVTTIPTKVKPDKHGKLQPLIGTLPDLDLFAMIKGVTPEEKEEVRKIVREAETKIAPKYGFSHNAYFVDVDRDYGIVDENDLKGAAHSLHPLKPKIILHGEEHYDRIQRSKEFQEHAQKEMELYKEKLKILSSAVYARTIANVWRQIRTEIKNSEREIKIRNNHERKEVIARKILAEELERALQDVVAHFAPLGTDINGIVQELREKEVDKVIADNAPRIYSYKNYGGKRMYLARRLANKDKETARILAIVEAANNLAMERARRRIKDINSMRKQEDRILTTHLFRAAKTLQRKILATAIEDLIHAKVETGRNAQADGYAHLPEKIYRYPKR